MFINNSTKILQNQDKIFYALHDANLDDFKNALYVLFSSIPNENYRKNNIQAYEGFYASIIYTYLSSLGFPINVEESTNKGRLDMSLKINNNRYIFEFKLGDKNALEQIKYMKYHEKYINEHSNIYLVSINFNKNEKNVSKIEWEKYNI